MTQPIKIDLVRIDGGTQPRVAISEQTVSEYAEAMIDANTAMPAVDVFFDGVVYWLADGFHRYHAARKNGLDYLVAHVHSGTRRDAVLFSVGANQAHGLRRTNDDKRRAVLTLLNDEEWAKWSNREIARRCGVGHQIVEPLRASLVAPTSEKHGRTYTTKHGTEAKMNVGNIGKTSPTTARTAAPTTYEVRKAEAIEGASQAVLRRLPRKADGDIVTSTIHALRGVIGAFEAIDPAALSNDPRAGEWRSVIAETISVLRSFNKRLERKAV